MMDLDSVMVFTKVVQSGSFTAAGRELGMPKSTVSRRVSELEENLGARLLQRTTRKLSLTDVGRAYYERSARIMTDLEAAELAVANMQAVPRGRLRVTAPADFATIAKTLIIEMAKAHPDVDIDMLLADRVVHLVDEGYDLAVRVGTLVDSTLIAKKLGTSQRILCASPGYLEARGTPQTPDDLAAHDAVLFRGGSGFEELRWSLEGKGGVVEVPVSGRATVNSFAVVQQLAVADMGIAFLPAMACIGNMRAGRLRRVLPDYASPPTQLSIVYPSSRHLAPKVRVFVDMLQDKVTAQLQEIARDCS